MRITGELQAIHYGELSRICAGMAGTISPTIMSALMGDAAFPEPIDYVGEELGRAGFNR